jgi:hypothetical protein
MSFFKKIFSHKSSSPKIGFGWVPDPANKKYLKFEKSAYSLTPNNIQYQSEDEIDLRPYSSPIQNQGSTSSCVSQAVVKALEIKRIIKHGHANHVDLSRAAVYVEAKHRMTPSMVDWDQGTYICLACDALRHIGVCREELHPFTKENIYKFPNVMALREARLNRIQSHFKIKSYGNERINDIIFNLKASNPVVFGTAVGNSWINYRGGSEPLKVEKDPVGLHAMVICGFVNGLFIIENSWGSRWGSNGFGFVDPEVFKHPSTQDLWVIVDGSEAWTEK